MILGGIYTIPENERIILAIDQWKKNIFYFQNVDIYLYLDILKAVTFSVTVCLCFVFRSRSASGLSGFFLFKVE